MRPGCERRPLAAAAWLNAPESRRVLDALAAGGRPARFVGGCVRDSLLDPAADPADLDLATPETPARVTALCRAAGLKVVPTGVEHGTVTVLVGDRGYEVTTLRRDVATDGRRATVAFTDDFAEDAARRDFTINAMGCDGEGRLFDPFGGQEDLLAGRVRFVGEPRARIVEDYLRVLRFFRFFARFGRPPADAAALAACRELAPGVDRLSGERVRGELLRLLEAPGAAAALGLMREAGVLARVLPAAPATLAPLERLAEAWPGSDGLLRLAALLRSAGVLDAAGVAARLRLSGRDGDRLRTLVALPLPDPEAPARAHRRALHRLGAGTHLDLLRLAVAAGVGRAAAVDQVERLAEGWDDPALPVSGADLLARGVPQGPGLGKLLARLRDWWEEEDFAPDRPACLARLDALLAARPDP